MYIQEGVDTTSSAFVATTAAATDDITHVRRHYTVAEEGIRLLQ